MKIITLKNQKIWLFLLISFFSLSTFSQSVDIEGDLNKWNKITLDVTIPGNNLSENATTFRNRRLDVIFTRPNGSTVRVAGFFAANGNAANSGSTSGNIYRAFLRPDMLGNWSYQVLFYSANDVAIRNVNNLPNPEFTLNGSVGNITEGNYSLPDLRVKGRLEYQNTGPIDSRRYLRFAETEEYFIKFGPDSPENFLDYSDFDRSGSQNCTRCFLHNYNPHSGDFNNGDPTWDGGEGRNIIGAVNYLSEEAEVNSMSMSLYGGDDLDVYPWVNLNNRFVFDVSKLAQWEIVFSHIEFKGLLMHFKLAEAENWEAQTETERNVYYREMAARFGHHLAVEWNIAEEYGLRIDNRNFSGGANNRINFLTDVDAWDNLVVIHTRPEDSSKRLYRDLLASDSRLRGASMQNEDENNYVEVFDFTLELVNRSRDNNTPYIVAADEQAPSQRGLFTSENPDNSNVSNDARKFVLWNNIMAGGSGVMWYGGRIGDFETEDMDRFDTLHEWCRIAVVDFFQNQNVRFWETRNADNLVSGNNNHCLANQGDQYVIYLPDGGSTNLNLNGQSGQFNVRWFNPRNGGGLQNGSVRSVNGGGNRSIGNPPNNSNEDWVALVSVEGGADPDPDPTDCTALELDAIDDFPNRNVNGFAPAAVDAQRGALSIDASQFQDEFAAAETTFNGVSSTYNVTINTLLEIDGESTYRLVVNNALAGSFQNRATANDNEDFSPFSGTFNNVQINNGDVIRVEFDSNSNGLIPEDGGFAFSRGRWTSIQLECSDDDTGGGDTTSPLVSFSNPQDGENFAQGIRIGVTVDASDADGTIDNVQLLLDGTLVRQEGGAPYQWGADNSPTQDPVFNNLAIGNHTLQAIATDNDGNSTSTTITINVITPPSVIFENPLNGDNFDQGTRIGVTVGATDADGTVDNVRLFLDGTLVRQENGAPYNWGADNSPTQDAVFNNLAVGDHTLEAIATDNDGGEASTSIIITINGDGNDDDDSDPNPECTGFQEIDGLVVMEAENLEISGLQWDIESGIDGASQNEYIAWNGPDAFGAPGTQGFFETTIQINNPGTYRFQWRSRVGTGENSTEYNDSWLRFPDADEFFGERFGNRVFPIGSGMTPTPNGAGGDGWFKVYLAGSVDWNWQTLTSDNDGHTIFVTFDNPGEYTMQISGRSMRHLLDRIVLSAEGISENDAQDLSNEETPCDQTTLSVDDNELGLDLVIYPNPATSFINISLAGSVSNGYSVKVYSVTGQIIMSETYTGQENRLQISNLSDGMYFLEVADNNSKVIAVKQFIKR